MAHSLLEKSIARPYGTKTKVIFDGRFAFLCKGAKCISEMADMLCINWIRLPAISAAIN